MRIQSFVITLFILFATLGFSQGTAIGKWKSYFPYKNVIDLVQHNKAAYGVTQNAVIIYDYTDNSIERITEVNGLSDVGLSCVGYNVANKTIVIGYENGNVDLIDGNETTNLFQIKESSISGDKKIYDIFTKGNLAYLSCGFGIVVFDVKKKEVKDTYIIGAGGNQLRIYDLIITEGKIYAATENGLYVANENSLFLTDYNSWSRITSIPHSTNAIKAIANTQGVIVTVSIFSETTDSVYVLKNGTWSSISFLNDGQIENVSAAHGKLMISQLDSVFVVDTTLVLSKTFANYDNFRRPKCNQITYDGNNFYIADQEFAIVRIRNDFDADWTTPEFIYSTNVLDIEVEDGNLWGASGSVVGTGWNKTYSNDGAFHYNIREDKWNLYNIHKLHGAFCFPNGCINDIIGIAVDPKNPSTAFACSFSARAIAEFSNNSVLAAYDSSNSALKISTSHNDRFAVKDGAFDEEGNLWAINSWVRNPLVVKTPSGTWRSFYCGTEFQHKLSSAILVDKTNGYKWVIFKDNSIMVYDDNQTPLDATDDRYKQISKGAAKGNLASIPVCISEDKDGEIWIGTDEGIYVLYSPIDVFEASSFEVQRIKVELEGNVELLLENEQVTSITIDGGNRKWIGTLASGIFVLSPDGTEQIHQFNEDNSSLLSNTINDIAIDGETGEVFISTPKGLISYKGEATEGQPAYVDVYAYPNPVEPGYTGKIAIKGLVANSDVRITDLNGNVVFNTISIGGQAIWDGNKLDKTRASSGIYLVFMTSEDGGSKQVAKILFMN